LMKYVRQRLEAAPNWRKKRLLNHRTLLNRCTHDAVAKSRTNV